MTSNFIDDELFMKIVDKDNLYESYRSVLSGDTKYTMEAMMFSMDEVYNLKALRESLLDGSYEFGGYISFLVYEPKERVVDAPHFKDKIVQLAIINVLREIYDPTFIFDSYACIEGKGTHKCAERIQEFLQRAKWEYGDDVYIIKGDLKKFYYSIDRSVVKKLLPKKIKCERTLELLFKIIDSAAVLGPKGIPLGNATSPLNANIVMNELDQFCKRKLSIKYYVRYMDDFFVICRNKEEANRLLPIINEFVETKLNMELNKWKTKIFPLEQGVNAIGFKIYTTHKLLRNDSKKKIKRKVKAMPRLIVEGRMAIQTAEQMLNSWKGHADFANSYNFIQKLINKHDFLYLVKKGDKELLKIDIKKLKAGYYADKKYKLSQLQVSN